MKYVLVYEGSRGGKHEIRAIESFENSYPNMLCYKKENRYGIAYHAILTIADYSGNILYNRSDYASIINHPRVVDVCTALYNSCKDFC